MALTLDETKKLLTVLVVDQPSIQRTAATIAVWLDELQDHWITLELAMSAARLYRRRPDAELERFRFLDIATFRHYLRRARDVKIAETRSAAARRALPPGEKKIVDPFRVRFPDVFARGIAEGRAKAAATHAYQAAIDEGATRADAIEQGNIAYTQDAAAPGGLDSLTERTLTP